MVRVATHECNKSYKHIRIHSVTQTHDENMFTKHTLYIMYGKDGDKEVYVTAIGKALVFGY
jgi:hypothetical protein